MENQYTKKDKPKPIGCLILFMIFPLFVLYFNTMTWYAATIPSITKNFTDAQIQEISEKLKFVLAPDESVSTEFWPGFLQASTELIVNVENIKSKDDFLSRYTGVSDETGTYGYESKSKMFRFEKWPKDYSFRLHFLNKDDSVIAEFFISGYVPDLDNIYEFSYDANQVRLRAFLSNWVLMILLAIEIVLVVFWIRRKTIWYLRKKSLPNQ